MVEPNQTTMSLTYQGNPYDPQALSSGLFSRVTKDPDSAIIVNSIPQERSAKRNAQQINYAEFDNINDDFEYDEERNGSNNTIPSASTHVVSSVPKHLLKAAKLTKPISACDKEQAIAKTGEQLLVPIKLNIEYNSGTSKLVDFFMWSVDESLVSPEQFASILTSDLELPTHVNQDIVDAITKQIEEYQSILTCPLPAGQDYFVIIELSVNLDKKLYEDKFEWDLQQTELSPEDFAETVVGDLGLSLEFKPAIAHSLHETILRIKREILEGTYNNELIKYQQLSGLIFESSIRIRTDSSLHNGNAVWEPFIEILSPWEIEKREIERERNTRRLKRENMRREVDDLSGTKRRAMTRRRDENDWRF